jgi:hypothetical protein
VSGYERVSSGMSADSTGFRSVTAQCPGSKVVIGGGYDTSGVSDPGDIVVERTGPSGNDSWTVEATSTGKSFAIAAWAICARAS